MKPRFGAILVFALAACGRGGDGPPAVGTLERDRLELVAETNDPIVEIAVREGDRVAAGQLVLRLDPAQLEARVGQVDAARERARARLAELERGPRAEAIAEGRARLAGAESAVETAVLELERARVLERRDIESRARLDLVRGQHRVAVARRDEARAGLAALLEGTTDEELEQARAALREVEAAERDAQLRLERLTVRAPSAARVDALPYELGERAPAGGVVAVLLDEAAPYARVYVPQPQRVGLPENAGAVVSVAGLDRVYRGRLRRVSAEAVFTPYFALTQYDRSRLAYLAEVDLVEPEAAALPTGVPVEVRFDPAPQVAGGAGLP
jgi:HlyD family secretion protein